jgi:ferric-dicitrate binding protein FerR (iron transport regulator)
MARAERAAAEEKASAAAASHHQIAAELASVQSSARQIETEKDGPSASHRPPSVWIRRLASTALALMVGVGAGMWLARPPSLGFGTLSAEPDLLRLRLDDNLTNPITRSQSALPRDRPR